MLDILYCISTAYTESVLCIALKSVLPFYVTTKLSKIRRATLDIPTPERYVKAQLSTVGLQTQSNGYFPHAVMVRPALNAFIFNSVFSEFFIQYRSKV